MVKPENLKLALIDGDVIVYRCGWSTQGKSEKEALLKVDDLMSSLELNTIGFSSPTNFVTYLTGKGNFRYDYNPEYKANRTGKPKPDHYQLIKDYLVETYSAIVVDGKEADDALATHITTFGEPESSAIVSIDKDMKTVNCWHYNIRYREWFYSSSDYALNFFYQQVLMGDSVDNIQGIRGVGPKKAEAALLDLTDECEMYSVCLEKYCEYYQSIGNSIEDSLGLAESRILKVGRQLHLQRYANERWEPDV